MLQARLKVIGGKHEGQVIPLTQHKFLIGREQDCQLRTSSGLVSRHHCVFTLDDYSLRLRDLGSTNGTFLNEERIRGEVILQAGDRVRVGKLMFEVELPVAATTGKADPPSSRTDFLFPAGAEVAPSVLSSDTAYELPVEPSYQEADTAIVTAADTAVITVSGAPEPPPQPPAPAPAYYPQQPYYDPYQQAPPGYYPPPQGQYPYPQAGYYPQYNPQYGMPYPQVPGYYPPPAGQFPYQPAAAPPQEGATAQDGGPPLRLPDPESTGVKPTPPGNSSAGQTPANPADATPSQRAADIIKDRMKRRLQG